MTSERATAIRRPETMLELLKFAEQHGDLLAVTCADQMISYSQLVAAARSGAQNLKAHGVRPRDRVTLYTANSIEWIVSYFATLEAGAIVNPVNILNSSDELAYITNDCGSALLLVDAAAVAKLGQQSGLPPLMTVDHATHDCAWIGDPQGGLAGDLQISPPSAGDVSTITYTSGTTGRPKGAMLSHRAVALNAFGTALMHARGPTDRCATGLPLAHAYGAAVLNAALLVGAPLFLAQRFEPQPFLDLLEREKITVMDGVPTMYSYLLALETLDRADLSALRCCLVGGQSMPPALMAEVERRFRAPLVELWGMTEVAGLGSTHDVRAGHTHGSIGKPLPGMELRLANLDNPAELAPLGCAGELIVRGPTLMEGYWNRPDATAEAIDQHGWLHSGDVAIEDADGNFSIVDRMKDMILSGGYNVYPAEIERVLAEHPDVSIAAVGRADDPARGEVPIAYVVARPGASCDAPALLEHCRARLARYKLPRAIHIVDDLPKTSTGKIMRRALQADVQQPKGT